MARLLLRLLLIASLVANGVAAPWAMAAMRHGDASLSHAHSGSHSMAGAEHEGQHAGHQGDHSGHHAMAPHAASDEDDESCCDGPGCNCGCVLPPMLARLALSTPAARAWSESPVAEPDMRAMRQRAVPPFRPPAA